MFPKKIIQILSLSFIFLMISHSGIFAQNKKYDVVIYGGTSAGIASAIQTSRMGKSVVIIEPTHRLGGLTTGGLGQTDIGNKHVIGGISREFYQNIRKYSLIKSENTKKNDIGIFYMIYTLFVI